MDRVLVRPNGPLTGEVAISGAKNSALLLMAATLLAPGEHVLTNVPRIADVATMVELLGAIGVECEREGTTDRVADAGRAPSRGAVSPRRADARVDRRARSAARAVRRGASGAPRRRRLRFAPDRHAPVGARGARRDVRARARVRAGLGGRLEGRAGDARVPERRCDREHPHGRRVGEGRDRDRERGARARDLRLGRPSQRDGRADRGCGHVDDRGRRRRVAPADEARDDPRPRRSRDVPRRGRDHWRRGAAAARTRRPHGDVPPQARRYGRDGHAHARRHLGARTAAPEVGRRVDAAVSGSGDGLQAACSP